MADITSKLSQPKDYKLVVEKDVRIPMRDGTLLYADIFRPDGGAERFPVIMTIGPYMKDKLWIVPPDLEEPQNEYMNWETPNPLWWCPRGYALLRVDSRGSGKSPGKSEPSSYQEALDAYDCIEWIAKRGWCNGNVGALGISYHANFQWRVASLQPPSLKAIMPWEGRADQYRDQAYHGGIFAMGFLTQWHHMQTAHHLLGEASSFNPDAFNNNLLWEYMRHNLDSEFWRACSARWDKITVPVYSVGNWGGFAMHLRGNTEGYLCAASKNKKLRIHTGSHYHPFHAEEARADQLRWFDHWLKGNDTGIMNEPPVKLEIRTGGSMKRYAFRFEDDWPIPRTRWTKLYLQPQRETPSMGEAEGRLSSEAPAASAKVTYEASPGGRHYHGGRTGVSFETAPMPEDTEITGPIVLNVWVSSTSKDMDILATVRNIGPDGKDVCEVGQRGEPVACVTKGWLRASHRKLDEAKSLRYRPYHAHDERQWLKPGEVVECRVEIWPTSMVFGKGHKLRLDIQPRDGAGTGHFTHYHADYNQGAHNTIHSGGERASYLLLPVIPAG
ncbi:MAG TPA: CocE/NonD family hydrolase [Burkholderiales bacterium]|nr:CocE/NonD family hydrolase [Burkholderiales bacterium]